LSEKRERVKKFDDQFLAKTDKYLPNFYIIKLQVPSSHVRCSIHTRLDGRKYSLTQALTKITLYTLKRIIFTTSRASEIKTRAKEAPPINLHSEKYIRILQMLETQLKRNKKENTL